MSKHAPAAQTFKYVRWFKDLGIGDVGLVGGKNASLGEMYQHLTGKGVRIPNGFATTAEAFWLFLDQTGLRERIKKMLTGLNTHDVLDLARRGKAVRAAIEKAKMPKEISDEIARAYAEMSRDYDVKSADVAVRSSATAEDLPDASFAGQQETYLNVVGAAELVAACQRCFASLFTDRAISYRHDKKFGQLDIALSVGVQKMVRSDLACAGVMFSLDTESGFRDAAIINGSYGLGEFIVLGEVTPDEFTVFKPKLGGHFQPIISRKLGVKDKKLMYASGSSKAGKPNTISKPVSPADRRRFCLTDREVLQLAKWAVIVEDHYKRPMDMEWAKDGRTDELFIVQARPETVQARKDSSILEEYKLNEKGRELVTGVAVGSKIGVGKVQVIRDIKDIATFKKGNVLVTTMTDPDWEPVMKIAAAIVTDQGGRTCHAAIVSRELGIPCVVGTGNGSATLKSGQDVTVSCAGGSVGTVYAGTLKFTVNHLDIKHLPKPKTKIMMNVGNPDTAFEDSMIPNSGVGLAREELIIANHIGVHPMALINFRQLKDAKARRKIEELAAPYKSKTDFYVTKLAEGIGKIAAAFYPRDVIVRLSDFRSNEYAELLGGRQFEPADERNPMIGWRGASRYYDPKFLPAFKLECEALKRVRNVMGLDNVKVMIPFCRTLDEGKKVLAVMAEAGLERGKDGLQVYVMCEIPANVILGEEFCKIFDGFSIGSNDLTQLTLGLDRDSELIAHVGNERNEAVKKLIVQIIEIGKRKHRKVGICGQAPSDFPDFVDFLVRAGIDSISLTPDTVAATTQAVADLEKKLKFGFRLR